MTTTLRMPVGRTALVAGLCFLAVSAATPADLPKETVKKATTADIAALQKFVEDIASEPAKNKKYIAGAKGLAAVLIVRGEGSAGKVGLALGKKDYKGAVEAAKGLGSGTGDKTTFEWELDDVMAPFKPTRSGGLNMEKDIKDAAKAGKIDAAAAEMIGARSAVLGDLTVKLPNDKAKTNPSMVAKWEKWSKEMAAAGKDLAEEGGKGATADQKKLTATLKKLDTTCINCHNEFRD